MAYYTTTDGVATMRMWHERLGHTGEQYLKMMADQGLVQGMLMTARNKVTCEACHVGKQRRRRRKKKRESKVTAPNQVVYADLMFPSKNNGTRCSAILVIMDGYSRYLTAYLLTKKDALTVNPLIMNYTNWAECQAGRNVKKIIHRQWEIVEGAPRLPVQIVLTDKCGEFVNREI
jgi:hypothetical protein